MKETKRNMMVRRVEAILLIMVLVLVSFSPITVKAASSSIQNVEEIDFSDFSNWRSGVYYYANGKYVEDSYRICLNDYVTFTSDKFKAHITDSAFRILIRELNASKSFLRSVTLVNGQTYEPGTGATYLAISVYKFVNGEKDMSYEVFENKFTNGFVAELCEVQDVTSSGASDSTIEVEDVEQDVTEEENTEVSEEDDDKWNLVEDIDFTDFSNWRTGYYHYSTGKYAVYSSRICLNDYVTFEHDEYTVNINKSGYQMLIREMDENMKFIKSYNLADGMTYTPSSKAVYLGISLYKLSESGVTYTTFKNLFADGFKATLDATEDIIVELPSFEMSGSVNSSLNNSVSTVKKTFYDCLKEALVDGDASAIDVSAYKVTDIEFYTTYCPQLREECFIEYHSGKSIYPSITTENGYITFVQYNMDDDYSERVKRVRATVNEYIAMVDNRMSDLEKILLAHEYVVNITEYNLKDKIAYTAGGPLGNGYGVCLGYADAMIVLLHEVGIEATTATSLAMNHSWVYVKLDGSWYHIDPTWSDTKKNAYAKYMHKFFLRNDEEFETIKADKAHYDWACAGVNDTSTSTKYTDWYVHDVAGTMYYYEGMWYYWDMSTNSILCSNIEGTITKVIVDGSKLGTITLNGISGNVLSYYIGTTQYSRAL